MPVKKQVKSVGKAYEEVSEKIKEDSLLLEKLPGYFLVACVLIALYFLLMILAPFVTVIFLAAVLVIAFYPLYRWLLQYVRYPSLASLISCLAIVLLIVIPVVVFILMLAAEGVNAYRLVQLKLESGVFDQYLQYLEWREGAFLFDLKDRIAPVVDLDSINLKDNIIAFAQTVSTYLLSQTANLVKGASSVIFNFVVMLFAMFYFFKDGDKILDKVGSLSPLPAYHEAQLFKKMGAMVHAIIFGVFLAAMAQGLVGGIGFAMAGIENPVFWGSAMTFFALLPMVGTPIIWLPAAIILFLLGEMGTAIFILIWGALVVGTIDNFIRPFFIGGRTHTYPLLMFFVILGGIWVLGIKGLIIGPMVLMVLISLLHIYEFEYSKILKR